VPELPEVETITRALAPRLTGRRILSAEFRCLRVLRGDPDETASRLAGKKIAAVHRRGKFIVMELAGGECFTAPGEVTGVFVVDGVVGDYLCARFGILAATPLTIHIEHNRITSVTCENKELERVFWEYTHTDENSDRVGEFAIGTNIGVSQVIGNILQDEKFPGIHIAFGDPYGAHTGAPWRSTTHIDVVGLGFNIWVGNAEGEEQIMREGRFLIGEGAAT